MDKFIYLMQCVLGFLMHKFTIMGFNFSIFEVFICVELFYLCFDIIGKWFGGVDTNE